MEFEDQLLLVPNFAAALCRQAGTVQDCLTVASVFAETARIIFEAHAGLPPTASPTNSGDQNVSDLLDRVLQATAEKSPSLQRMAVA